MIKSGRSENRGRREQESGQKRGERRGMGRRRDGGSWEEEEEVSGCVSPAAGQT